MKKIAILGSTGSIGKSALRVVESNRNDFRIVALTAWNNVPLLEKQIRVFRPQVVVVADGEVAARLEQRLGKKLASSLRIMAGSSGVEKAAAYSAADFVLSAIVGAAGLTPTLAAIRARKTIGLANKETLVIAGDIIVKESRKYGVKILPVDSEHSAIFQCVEGYRHSDIRRIILTASGGPFVNRRLHEMKRVTPGDALKHPKWKMGRKISIDSATLMNKGLEVIEAHYLFGLPPERIDVLVHPESIVHSLVEFDDRSCLAQLSVPDMRGPIAYALTYPERIRDVLPGLSLEKVGMLSFQKPDTKCFPCLSFAYKALKVGGTMPAVVNAANEIAVSAFLDRTIGFTDIPLVISKAMKSHTSQPQKNLKAVMEADMWARKKAQEIIRRNCMKRAKQGTKKAPLRSGSDT